jgi:hypothetical protein
MIISRKRFNEKIAEAVDRAERERWIQERINRIEAECAERIDGVHRRISDLERRLFDEGGELKCNPKK